jgi:hypothetical protein
MRLFLCLEDKQKSYASCQRYSMHVPKERALNNLNILAGLFVPGNTISIVE